MTRRQLHAGLVYAAVALSPLICGATAFAGEADVVGVEVTRASDGRYRFDVTVRHADTGWEHYADGWEVAGEDGTRYGYRKLLHPHVGEQPFTRSLSGVVIPDTVSRVVIRAHDLVDAWGGAEMIVDLPK